MNPIVHLRAIEPEDLDLLYRIENDVKLWNVGTTNVPYSRYTLHDYVANASDDIYTDRQVRLMVEDAFPVKNVKGSLNIRNGKIINGACYGVIGKDTTLALTAQPNTTSDDSIVSLSVSNAGEFLKYFKFIDGINGGTLNIVLKNSIISDSSIKGSGEITIIHNDFCSEN